MKEIYSRRSIRKYLDKKIPDDIVKEIIKAGMNAPSAHNSKPYEFIVVEDKDILLKLSEIKPEASFVKWSNKTIVLLAYEKTEYWQQDLGATAQNMLLMAHYHKIGSCWVGIAPNSSLEEKVRNILNIPKEIRVFCLLPMGYSDRTKEVNDYYDEKIVHQKRYK